MHLVTFSFAGEERLGAFRRVGEYCVTYFNGPEALENYQSISQWQAETKPLWLSWTPAAAWAALALYWRRRSDLKAETRISRIDTKDPGSIPPPSDLRFTFRVLRVSWLTWAAVGLAAAALAVTGIHLLTPQLAVTERTLGMARRFLVSEQERGDFEWLAGQGIWEGERLGTLLEHVQLAGYNRGLVNWKVDGEIYREYVLSPVIGTGAGGAMNRREIELKVKLPALGGLAEDAEKTKAEGRNRKVTEIGNRYWRRVLWESFYPRIRKEESPEAAAEIVGRYLRERMTVLEESRKLKAESGNQTPLVNQAWRRQVTDGAEFEVLSVAALRSVGIGARLDGEGRAEFWTGERWRGNNNKVTK